MVRDQIVFLWIWRKAGLYFYAYGYIPNPEAIYPFKHRLLLVPMLSPEKIFIQNSSVLLAFFEKKDGRLMLQSFSLFMQRKVEQYRRSSQKIREVSLPLLESGTEIYFPMNIREWLISVRGKLFLACSLSYIGPFYNLTSLEESTSYFLFKRKDSLKGLSCKRSKDSATTVIVEH